MIASTDDPELRASLEQDRDRLTTNLSSRVANKAETRNVRSETRLSKARNRNSRVVLRQTARTEKQRGKALRKTVSARARINRQTRRAKRKGVDVSDLLAA